MVYRVPKGGGVDEQGTIYQAYPELERGMYVSGDHPTAVASGPNSVNMTVTLINSRWVERPVPETHVLFGSIPTSLFFRVKNVTIAATGYTIFTGIDAIPVPTESDRIMTMEYEFYYDPSSKKYFGQIAYGNGSIRTDIYDTTGYEDVLTEANLVYKIELLIPPKDVTLMISGTGLFNATGMTTTISVGYTNENQITSGTYLMSFKFDSLKFSGVYENDVGTSDLFQIRYTSPVVEMFVNYNAAPFGAVREDLLNLESQIQGEITELADEVITEIQSAREQLENDIDSSFLAG